VEVLAGVKRVIPISKPYKMASREFKGENTLVAVPNNRGQVLRIGGRQVTVIAGPCAVESREQIMGIARLVALSGAVMLRGGAYKPRTSPYAFQGLGEEGLRFLKEAGDAFGMPVVTELVSPEHIPVMRKYGVDVFQIGARNMQNFELLKKVGEQGRPVLLKRGISATIEEWLMAAEYLLSSGADQVVLCERGIRTYEKATRNTLDLSAIPVLRALTHLPIIVDPSHAVGLRDKVPPMALAAIAAGADGLFVEVHCDPDHALSDGPQNLFPEQFDKLMRDLDVLAPVVGKEVARLRKDAAPIDAGHAAPKGRKVTAKDSVPSCAFCGTRGAFAEQAILRYFGDGVGELAMLSFREAFQAVSLGAASFLRRATSFPTTGASTSRSRMSLSNCSGKRFWGPSERAWSGSQWTSTMRPSAPAAIAARAMGGTLSRRPTAWLGSTMMGRWVRERSTGMADRSRVLRVAFS
jgi:3-deoxy-7-phosphoheptulonate synthase